MERITRILKSKSISLLEVLEARLVVVNGGYLHLQILAGDDVVDDRRVDNLREEELYSLIDLGSGRADNGTYFISLSVIYANSHLNVALTYGEGESTLYSIGCWDKSQNDVCYAFSETRQEFISKPMWSGSKTYAFNGTEDDFNYIFNRVCTVPDVHCIALDIHNIDRINPEIVTDRNIWHILVMLALVTENSGAHLLHRYDVMNIICLNHKGTSVLEAVKKCVKVISDTPEPDNIKRVINEIANG